MSAISDGNSKISLNNVTGNWATGDKIVGDNEITQSAPDPDSLQFVSSVPESANGEVQNWSLATWNVSGQTETKAIVPGEQQTLDVGNDINLLEGTNYSVTVQYDADDADPVIDPSLFKTVVRTLTVHLVGSLLRHIQVQVVLKLSSMVFLLC